MTKDLKLKPLADGVVIKPIEEAESSPGGIILPDSAREKPQKGEVVAVGPGKMGKDGKRDELEVKVGDVVLFRKYGGTELKMEGIDYKIMSVNDILAVIL